MKDLVLKFKRLLKTDLVKVSFFNGLGTFFKMFSGLISIKAVASIVGPAGMALLGQLNNFTVIIQSIAGGGITTGLTRYISEHVHDRDKVNVYIGTALKLTLLGSCSAGIILVLFGSQFSELLFSSFDYTFIFRIFGFSIIIYALNALLMAILNGYKQYRIFININLLGSVVSLIFSVVLAFTLGLKGAMLSVVTYQSVVFFISVIWLFHTGIISWSFIRFDFSYFAASQLFQYSLMALVSAIVIPFSQIFVRGYIVDHISTSDAGMWEGVNRISSMYLQIIISSLSIYYLPRLAELKEDSEYTYEVRHVYSILLPFLLCTSLIIYIFRNSIISLLFTIDFQEMEKLFSFQLIGDILKVTGWILGYIMVAKAMVKTYIITEIFNYLIFILLSILFINWIGVKGVVIAYATSHAFYLVLMMIKFRHILFVH
jgi:PST family polysaccharide transporter